MYYSVENRSPYLDRDLFDWCGRIPTRHLIRRGLAKAPLRDAVRDLLPASIVENPRKVGFNASVKTLLDTSDPQVRSEVLADSPIFDYVRRDAIRGLLDRPQLDDSEGKFLFSFLSSKMFLERFAA
jgi:asparagine synthase (glutamine-hydrolysing)